MIVLNILGYFGRNKENSYAALSGRQLSISAMTRDTVLFLTPSFI